MRPEVLRRLGLLRGPVLQLLQREVSLRWTVRKFHAACVQMFAPKATTDAAVHVRSASPNAQ